MKKVLSLLIAVAMLTAMMITPAMVSAATKNEVELNKGDNGTSNGVWVSTSSSTAYGGKLNGEYGICMTRVDTGSERRISTFVSAYGSGKYVYGVNFLYTGSARPLMYSMSNGIDLFVVNSAGQVGYGLPNTFVDTYLEESKWYNLSVEMDKDNKVFKIYLNGVLIGEHTDNRTDMTGFDIGMLAGEKSSAVDEVYYDDMKTYPGEYDASEHIIGNINGQKIGLANEDETISYAAAAFDSVDALENEIMTQTGAQSVRICNVSGSTYTDASELAPGEIAVIKKGDAYRYYTLADGYTYEANLADLGIQLKTDLTDQIKSQITLLDKELAVFAAEGEDKISSSDSLVAALESAEGYTLSYVDSEKAFNSQTLVKDGYILASKGSEEHYFEIISRTGEQSLKLSDGDANRANFASLETLNTSLAGLTPDSTYEIFNVNEENGSWTNRQFSHQDISKVWTYEFNVYVGGGATAQVSNTTGSNDILWLLANGTLQYQNGNGYMQGVISDCFDPNIWHRVAVVHSGPAASAFEIYIDGKYVVTTADVELDSGNNTINIGNGSEKGMSVAFGDIDFYYGFYDPSEDILSVTTPSDSLYIDEADSKMYYNGDDSFENVVLNYTDAIDVTLYTDNTFAEKASSVGDNAVAVIITGGGKARRYYKVSYGCSVEFTITEDNDISVNLFAGSSDTEDATLYLAEYNDAGDTLLGITTAAAAAGYNDSVVTLDYNEGNKYKAFLWKNSGLVPVKCIEQ